MSVSLDDGPSPDDPGHTRRVAISYRGQDIGRLDYRVYTVVDRLRREALRRRGTQDRGLATRALAKTRSLYPGFRWCTSGQYVTGANLWARTARKAANASLPTISFGRAHR